MNARQRGFAHLFLISFLAIAGVGIYYLGTKNIIKLPSISMFSTPVPSIHPLVNKFMNWKTYTNTQYGYSIKYPSTWKTANVAAGNTAPEALPNSRHIELYEIDHLPEYKAESITVQALESPILPDETKVINNLTFRVFSTNHGEVYYIQIPNQNMYLEITGASGNTADESKNKTIQEIFSTFEFVDNKTSDDISFVQLPSNWTQSLNTAKSVKNCYKITGKNIGKINSINIYLTEQFGMTTTDIDQLITNTPQVSFQGVSALTLPAQNLGEIKRVYVRPGDEFWYEIEVDWAGAGEGTTPNNVSCDQEKMQLDTIIKSIAFH